MCTRPVVRRMRCCCFSMSRARFVLMASCSACSGSACSCRAGSPCSACSRCRCAWSHSDVFSLCRARSPGCTCCRSPDAWRCCDSSPCPDGSPCCAASSRCDASPPLRCARPSCCGVCCCAGSCSCVGPEQRALRAFGLPVPGRPPSRSPSRHCLLSYASVTWCSVRLRAACSS